MPLDSDDDFPLDDDGFEEGLERPRGLRFGEGQPINRAGRPLGSPNDATITKRVARRRHRVSIDGKPRRLDTMTLVLMAVRKKAAQGDLAAFDLQQRLLEKYGPARERPRGVFICPGKLTSEEWEATYGTDQTDEEVGRQFPYLMRARRAFQQYQSNFALRVGDSLGRPTRPMQT